MLVLINGLPYFGKIIAKELSARDSSNKYIFLDTYYSKWDKIRLRFLLPFSKTFISFNGVSDQSGSLDLVLRQKKKLLMQWHGSDVKFALERFHRNEFYSKYIDNAIHIFSAPWFEEELKPIVKNGIYAPFSFVENFGKPGSYNKIKVLSYLAAGKEEYYGWAFIASLAEKNPEIEFTIVGTNGEGLPKIKNVYFKGWVSSDDMTTLYESHPIFIRLCEHDGKSFAVSQALAMGCEVLWNYPQKGVHQVQRTQNSIEHSFEAVLQVLMNRNLANNPENIRIAKEELSKEFVLERFVEQIKLLLK